MINLLQLPELITHVGLLSSFAPFYPSTGNAGMKKLDSEDLQFIGECNGNPVRLGC